MRRLAPPVFSALLAVALLVVTNGYAQHEREVPLPKQEDYGPPFLDQLHRMFERYSNADLHRVFQMARPAACAELIADAAEWKDVAFFYGKQKWYRISVAELRSDPAVYVFKGVCHDQLATLQVTTSVPVDGSATFKMNAPVTAAFVIDTKAYTFDLPYLFRTRNENGGAAYTFNPRNQSDRYLTHITSHWECKAVAEEYVTYPFMICRITLFGHDPIDIKPDMRDKPSTSFGATAYLILSDGRERSR